MRTVNLICFTEDLEYSMQFYPEVNRFYKVVDLEDEFYYEEEDDDGYTEELSTSSISIVNQYNQKRHITHTDNADYKLLTIELDDDCQLFK